MSGVAAALLVVALTPTMAWAKDHSESRNSGSRHSPRALVNGYQRQLLGMTQDDQWFFDDGCIGGSSDNDPLYMLVPLTDPASTESACAASDDARIVIVAAGLTCWQPTLKAARDECEAGWADPALVLQEASVTIDGKAKELKTFRVSGRFTFPDGAIFDAAGLKTSYYGITSAVIVRGLKAGVHEVSISFSYADGFAGATTFALTVTDD